MKKAVLFLFALAFFAFSSHADGWKGISNPQPAPGEIRLVNSDITTSTLQFSLEGFFMNKVSTPRGDAYTVSAPKGASVLEKGAPDLYKFAQSIIIPDMDQMEIKVLDANYTEYENVIIAPSKGNFSRDIDPSTVPYVWGSEYEKDAFWPGQLAQLEAPYIFRDFRGQAVTFCPFQYNPVTKVLRVYTDIRVEVKSNGKMGENAFLNNKKHSAVSSEYNEIYKTHFANYQAFQNTRYTVVPEEGRMLIISHPEFAASMKPFVDWKRSIGIPTEIVTTAEAGTTAAAIKTYVTDYYNAHEDFTFLLLVGDFPQIPGVSASAGYSDNAYGYMTGSDSYSEFFVGRFSAETIAHVETQVQRMIEYERDMNSTDTWLNVGMGIGKNEGAGGGHNGGEADYVHMDFIRDSLLNFTYETVLREYEGVSGLPNTSPASISAGINAGVSIINYCNHGSETSWGVAGYSNTHVNALTNVGMLPFIWSVACVNGAYNYDDSPCFAEAWMRATHDDQPTGAIGTMMSTINQDWQPPMTGQDEMVTILVEKRDHIKRTFAGLSINGSMKMIDLHSTSGKNMHDTWVLFGDPSLMVRTDVPEAMDLSYNPVLFIGASSMEVTGDVDGARITLSYVNDEEEVIIVGSAVMQDGVALLEFPEAVAQPMTLKLTAVAFNKVTSISDVEVVPPSGPYMIYKSMQIVDNQGNNNGQADYGETIKLNVALQNVGIEIAENVQAVLSTEDENVEILQNTAVWGDIINGTTTTIENAFTIKVKNQVPNNHTVRFDLAITGDDKATWESAMSMKVYTSLFTIGNLVVDDSQSGNNNSRLDPGETAQFKFALTNNGGAPAQAPVADLSIVSPYITIAQSHIDMPVVASGEAYEAIFEVTANASQPEGTMYQLNISVEDAYTETSSQEFVVGQMPQVTIGTGTETPEGYPFYNWYKANRSQMLYLESELGAGDKTITEIAFDLARCSSSANNLANFKIIFKPTTATTLTGAFANTADGTVVFQSASYQMPAPTATGWHTWDIEDYELPAGQNLIIEVIWGLIPNYCASGNFFTTNSTEVAENRVVYGYDDNQASPTYDGSSNKLPNLFVTYEATEEPVSHSVTFTVTEDGTTPLEGASVKIGSATYLTNTDGVVNVSLYEGDYNFGATKTGYSKVENQELALTENKNIAISLSRVMYINFNIIGQWNAVVTNAVITLNDQAYPAGQYMIEGLVAGSYTYTVNAPYYFQKTGQIDITEFDNQIDIELIADGTGLDNNNQGQLSVYPNPAKDVLNVRLGNTLTADVQIINIIGEVVSSHNVVNGALNINTQSLPVGTYFVRIMSNDKLTVKKVSIVR